MLALGVFLPLVLTALTVSWHNHDIRNICLALVLTWIVSNVVALTLPFDYRIIVYPVLEAVVGLVAGGAWLMMRFEPGESRAAEGQVFSILIVAVALASVAACVNYAVEFSPQRSDRYLFVLWTNICFALECLLAGAWGIRDAFHRAAGVARLLRRSRADADGAGAVARAGTDAGA